MLRSIGDCPLPAGSDATERLHRRAAKESAEVLWRLVTDLPHVQYEAAVIENLRKDLLRRRQVAGLFGAAEAK